MARRAESADADEPVIPARSEVKTLSRKFVELGLAPQEGLVLVSLLCLGSANTLELSRLSGVPRGSIYQNLQALEARGVADPVPGEGPATWTTPGRAEVLLRLDEAEQERLAEHRTRAEELGRLLDEVVPDAAAPPLPFVQFLRGALRVRRVYEEVVAGAQAEVMVFSRPPYSLPLPVLHKVVVETTGRGVRLRALYPRELWDTFDAAEIERLTGAYRRAGMEAAVADQVPMKLVVADRRIALLAMDGPAGPGSDYPTFLLIDDPGFAEVQAEAFEKYWATATPV